VLALVPLLAGCGTNVDGLNPVTPQGDSIERLFVLSLVLSGLVFLLVAGLLGWFMLRYRAGPHAREPAQRTGNRRLEIVWTAAPALLLTGLFVLTVRTMLDVEDPPPEGMHIQVIGHQWWWEYRYPDGTVTANDLHLPTGAPVALDLTSADVIHSFWVPQLGWKIDLIPGKTNTIWFTVPDPVELDGACAEYCGAQHAWMRIHVVAQSPADFAAWLAAQDQPAAAPTDPLAVQGQQVFFESSCASCHTIAGTSANGTAGPDLTHIASRPTLGAGVVANTPRNLSHWVRDPQTIKPGVLMPAFTFSDADLQALVAYLEGLK